MSVWLSGKRSIVWGSTRRLEREGYFLPKKTSHILVGEGDLRVLLTCWWSCCSKSSCNFFVVSCASNTNYMYIMSVQVKIHFYSQMLALWHSRKIFKLLLACHSLSDMSVVHTTCSMQNVQEECNSARQGSSHGPEKGKVPFQPTADHAAHMAA